MEVTGGAFVCVCVGGSPALLCPHTWLAAWKVPSSLWTPPHPTQAEATGLRSLRLMGSLPLEPVFAALEARLPAYTRLRVVYLSGGPGR